MWNMFQDRGWDCFFCFLFTFSGQTESDEWNDRPRKNATHLHMEKQIPRIAKTINVQ